MNTNELIKLRRKELKLTMREVAEAVGVSEATVSRWESGNIANMGRDKIALLSKVLKISPSQIAGYDEDKDNSLGNLKSSPTTSKFVDDESLKFALFGGDKEITDEQLEEVKRFAKFVKDRDKNE